MTDLHELRALEREYDRKIERIYDHLCNAQSDGRGVRLTLDEVKTLIPFVRNHANSVIRDD